MAHQTVFQGVDKFAVSEVPKESTAISVREMPMVTGTLFRYSVVGKARRRASVLNTWFPIGKDSSASRKPTYSMASPSSLNVNQLINGVYGDTHSLTIIKAYMCHLASSVQHGCHCIAIHCDLFLIGPSN